MQIDRTPNIRLSKHKDKNWKDRRPSKGEFFGRKGIGPFKKNFAIPKALDNRLKMNVIEGSHQPEARTFATDFA